MTSPEQDDSFHRRAGLFLLLVALCFVAVSYAVFAFPSRTVLVVMAAAAILGTAAPATAIALTLALAPIIDGLVALLYGLKPYQFATMGLRLTEPLFVGAALGIVLQL